MDLALDDGSANDEASEAVKFFWQMASMSSGDDTDETNAEILDWVAAAEARHRLDIEPDYDPFNPLQDAFGTSRLIVAQHLAALRALVTKGVHGRTEDYLDNRQRALSLGSYLRLQADSCAGRGPFWISAKGVHAALLLERYETARVEGHPGAALAFLTAATRSFQDALDGAYEGSEDEYDQLLKLRLQNYVDDIDVSTQTIVDLIEAAFDAKDATPQEIASACEFFQGSEFWTDLNETVVDADGEADPFFMYLVRARERARQKIHPDEFVALLRKDQEEQAENRLRRYFFGESAWAQIPERARAALIDVDDKWFRSSRGRIETVLEHLQTAAEAICYETFWKHLVLPHIRQQDNEWLELAEFLDSHKRNSSNLASGRSDPNLTDFRWVFSSPPFRAMALRAGFRPDEIEFLAGGLTNRLRELVSVRGAGVHVNSKKWRRQEVEPYLHQFLGIGTNGTLPALLRIWSDWRGRQEGR